MTISILGLGYIGLPTAITFALSGVTVCGVDIKKQTVDMLVRGELPIEEDGLAEALAGAVEAGRLTFDTTLPSADAYIITVQTPQRPGTDGDPVSDISFVRQAARDIGAVLKAGQLVILESTVPPKTTHMMQAELVKVSGLSADSFHVAHCPERVIPGKIFKELRENDRIIGADDPASADLAKALYQRILTTGQVYATDTITAEMCKLSENTFRDINIAYANELSVICQKMGVDVFNLIQLANKHPRVNILTPGVGVGGHCIAVDPWFIHEAFPEDAKLIGTARRVNDHKPYFVAEQIAKAVGADRRICVLGLAFKADVDDMRESPSLKLCHILADKGFNICACEPHVHLDTVDGFVNKTLACALAENDYLVIAMGHTIFKEAKAQIAAQDVYDCVGLL